MPLASETGHGDLVASVFAQTREVGMFETRGDKFHQFDVIPYSSVSYTVPQEPAMDPAHRYSLPRDPDAGGTGIERGHIRRRRAGD